MEENKKKSTKTIILEMITQSSAAMSHNEIQTVLEDSCNRVTIYRILDRLVEDGLLHKIVDTNGVSKFAACHQCSHKQIHAHNHVHFSCSVCHKVTCLEDLIPAFEMPPNYTVTEMNFVVSGICAGCNS